MASSIILGQVSSGGGAVSVGPANPESISVKTTSYTIPAGKSARVVFTMPDATINGSFVFHNQTVSTGSIVMPGSPIGYRADKLADFDGVAHVVGSMTRNQSGSSWPIHITSQTPAVYSAYTATPVTPSTYYSRLNSSTGLSLSFNFFAVSSSPSPLVFWCVQNSTSSGFTTSCSITTLRILRANSFFVPAGTVIAGSGSIVEEYINT